MTDNTKFLGFDKAQIPLLSLLLAGLIMLAGMFYQVNSNINALRADVNALRAEMNANDIAHRAEINTLRSETNANINALRSEMNALRTETNSDIDALRADINALTLEMAETNARIENIERSLPGYAYMDDRLDGLEREQARLNELVKALTNPE